MTDAVRFVGLVPAAGLSRRMGTNKLVLPLWGKPLICHVIDCLTSLADVSETLVVIRRDASDVADVLADRPVTIVRTVGTRDMRATVECGVRFLEQHRTLVSHDALVIAPGDCAGIRRANVLNLINAYRQLGSDLTVPVYRGRRGHPLLLAWRVRHALFRLPPDAGLNRLFRMPELSVTEVSCLLPEQEDADTPEEFEQLRRQDAPE